MNLKEELAERHLLASEERSPSCCDWGGIALGDGDDDHGDDDHEDNDDYNDADDDDDYNSDEVDNVVSGNALTWVVTMAIHGHADADDYDKCVRDQPAVCKRRTFSSFWPRELLFSLVIRVELWPNAPTDLAMGQTKAHVMLSHLHGSVLVSITSILLPLVASSAILLLLHPPVPTLSAPPDTKILLKLSFVYIQVSNWSASQLAYVSWLIWDSLAKRRRVTNGVIYLSNDSIFLKF